VSGFVNTVLDHGEVLFEDLERVLKSSGEGEGEHGGEGERPVTRRHEDTEKTRKRGKGEEKKR
jgi:hypothetical protein